MNFWLYFDYFRKPKKKDISKKNEHNSSISKSLWTRTKLQIYLFFTALNRKLRNGLYFIYLALETLKLKKCKVQKTWRRSWYKIFNLTRVMSKSSMDVNNILFRRNNQRQKHSTEWGLHSKKTKPQRSTK